MTVFGFGRKGFKELVQHVPDLKRLPARYSIAFIERADRDSAEAARRNFGAGLAALPDDHARFARAGSQGDARCGAAPCSSTPAAHDCSRCHKVRGEGGDVGPDLSDVGGKLDRDLLIQSVIEPSRQVVEGYRTTVLALSDGRVLSGIVREEEAIRAVAGGHGGKAHVDRQGRRRGAASPRRIADAGRPGVGPVSGGIRRRDRLPREPPGGRRGSPGSGLTGPVALAAEGSSASRSPRA